MRIILIIVIVLFSSVNCYAKEYSDQEIVDAIYLAEGGKKAQFPYGIRSIKCSGEVECRRICENTVRNNRKRFSQYGYKDYNDFIEFLGSRYCPTSGNNLSKSERKLNGNWVKNVNYFLDKKR